MTPHQESSIGAALRAANRIDELERQRVGRAVQARFGADDEPLTLGRFKILDRLGRGAHGLVYSAYDPALDRVVALKVYPADSSVAQDEARALAQTSHPNVLRIFEVVELDGFVVLVVERLRGVPLLDWARDSGISKRRVLALFVKVAEGLEHIHACGLVHRDVKPGNIIVVGRDQPVVVDFSLASGAPEQVSNKPAGTPRFAAPEQSRGVVDRRSDQYGLATSLITTLAIAEGNVSGTESPEPASPAGVARVPWGCRRVVRKALADDPAARFASIASFARALRWTMAFQLSLPFVAILMLCTGAAQWALSADERSCAAFSNSTSSFWSAEQRNQVTAAFAGVEVAGAPQTGESLVALMDDAVRSWTTQARRTCETHASADRSQEPAWLCLRSELLRLQTIANRLAAPDRGLVENPSPVATLLASDTCDQRSPRWLASLGDDMDETLCVGSTIWLVALESSLGNIDRAQALLDELPESGAPPCAWEPDKLLAQAYIAEIGADYAEQERFFNEAGLRAEQCDRWDIEVKAEVGSGRVALQHYELAEARAWLARAQATERRADRGQGPRTQLLAGLIAQQSGDCDVAVARYAEVVAEVEARRGPFAYELAPPLSYLAGAYRCAGRQDSAVETWERTIEVVSHSVGDQHVNIVFALGGMGLALLDLDPDAAASVLTEAIAMAESLDLTDSDMVTQAWANLGVAHTKLGRPDAAEPLLRLAVERLERSRGASYPGLAEFLVNLASALLEQNRYDEAITIADRALALIEQHPTPSEDVSVAARLVLAEATAHVLPGPESVEALCAAASKVEAAVGADSDAAVQAHATCGAARSRPFADRWPRH